MKQVLAVRVGAKKAVGHIVSKRWWPTVRLQRVFSVVTCNVKHEVIDVKRRRLR